jgi:hypothetical protein
MWALSASPSPGWDTLTIEVTALPDAGSSPITGLEWQLAPDGAWTPLEASVGWSLLDGETLAYTAADGETQTTFTITAPAEYAGDYTLTFADLDTGPVNLVPPIWTGTPTAGQTLTAQPGIWVYDDAGGAPVLSYEWVAADGSSFTPPVTGQTYTVAADAADTGISLKVTGVNASGARSSALVEAVPQATISEMAIGPNVYADIAPALPDNPTSVVIAGRIKFDPAFSDDVDFVRSSASPEAFPVVDLRRGPGGILYARATGEQVSGSSYFWPISFSPSGYLSFVASFDVNNALPNGYGSDGWLNGGPALALKTFSTATAFNTGPDSLWLFRGYWNAPGGFFANGFAGIWLDAPLAAADVAAELFNADSEFSWKSLPADGTITVGGTDYSPALWVKCDAADFNAGTNYGTGSGYTVTGAAT